MKEDISKWKDTPYLWIGSFNIVKISLLSKAIYIFNTVAINILMTFHRNKKRLILKFIWNFKGPWITKKKKKNPEKGQSQRNHTPWFQSSLQSDSNQIEWYWHKVRHRDQWKRIQDPKTNPHTLGQTIFDKGIKSIHWTKDSLFNKWF